MSTGTVKWFNPTKAMDHPTARRRGDVFVTFLPVERPGLSRSTKAKQVEFEIVSNRGKSSQEILRSSDLSDQITVARRRST